MPLIAETVVERPGEEPSGQSFYGSQGAGLAEGALFDRLGRCGRSAQSLILAER